MIRLFLVFFMSLLILCLCRHFGKKSWPKRKSYCGFSKLWSYNTQFTTVPKFFFSFFPVFFSILRIFFFHLLRVFVWFFSDYFIFVFRAFRGFFFHYLFFLVIFWRGFIFERLRFLNINLRYSWLLCILRFVVILCFKWSLQKFLDKWIELSMSLRFCWNISFMGKTSISTRRAVRTFWSFYSG